MLCLLCSRNVRRDAMKQIEKLEKDGSLSGVWRSCQCHAAPCCTCCAAHVGPTPVNHPLSFHELNWQDPSTHQPACPPTEDQRKDLENTVQKLTDDYVKQIDGLVKGKQDELSKV